MSPAFINYIKAKYAAAKRIAKQYLHSRSEK